MKLAILFASQIAWSRSSAQNLSNRMLLLDNTYRNDGTWQIYECDDSQDPHAGRITTSLLSQFSHDAIFVLCLSLKALESEHLLVEIVAVQALQERRDLAALGILRCEMRVGSIQVLAYSALSITVLRPSFANMLPPFPFLPAGTVLDLHLAMIGWAIRRDEDLHGDTCL
jgi:hypothetical protein